MSKYDYKNDPDYLEVYEKPKPAKKMRKMVCECGSNDIGVHKNIGSDVWDGGEIQENKDICHGCGKIRIWNEGYNWEDKEEIYSVGIWEKDVFNQHYYDSSEYDSSDFDDGGW